MSRDNRAAGTLATPNLGAFGAGGVAIAPFSQSQNAISRRIDYLGTVRGRVRLTFDRLLIYWTGGLAYGQTRPSCGLTFPVLNGLIGAVPGAGGAGISGINSSTKTSVGYAADGGIEYAINQNWSIKARGYTTSRLPVGDDQRKLRGANSLAVYRKGSV